MSANNTVKQALCHAIHTMVFTGQPSKPDPSQPDIDGYISDYAAAQDNNVYRLHQSGMSYRNISVKLNVPVSTVQSIIKRRRKD